MPQKKDPDTTAGQKLLALRSILVFSNQELSLGELSEKLCCSKQTVLRLLDQLEAGGERGLIREVRSGRAFYRMLRPARRPVLALSPEGLEQLALCRDLVLHLLPKDMRSTLEDSLNKAGALLPDNADTDAYLTPQAAVLTKGAIDYTPFQPFLNTILGAVRHKTVLSLKYRNTWNEARAFDFAPVRLLRFHDTLYAQGWEVSDKGRVDRLYDNPMSLPVQRLTDVGPTRRSFSTLNLPPLPEGEAFGFALEEPFAVSVRFAPGAPSTYVRERTWSREQRLETDVSGWLVLHFTARNIYEVLSWVLSFGSQAEALAPERLRDEVARATAEAAAIYCKVN